MIPIDQFIKELEDLRAIHKFKYNLAIVSETHISVCIVTKKQTGSVGCYNTKHFLIPINYMREVDDDQIVKYIKNKYKSYCR